MKKLERAQNVAETYLSYPLVSDPKYPMRIHHPFTDSWTVHIINDQGKLQFLSLKRDDNVGKWKQFVKGEIYASSSPEEVCLLITEEYKKEFLEKITRKKREK